MERVVPAIRDRFGHGADLTEIRSTIRDVAMSPDEIVVHLVTKQGSHRVSSGAFGPPLIGDPT